MWRRIYLLLLLVRAYFALCPSYIHPDENFQGPEVIAGSIFGFPSRRTWEWTSDTPIRSVFPLWPAYGLPMTLLHWLWPRGSDEPVNPSTVYYTIRFVMFILSFVLEDWAVWELVRSPRYRKQAMVLVASSYVTWTYQTHTFSNSVETLIVLWSLVLIERIAREEVCSIENIPDFGSPSQNASLSSSFVLAFLLVFGTFNRVTFPAFVMIPGIILLPQFWNRPSCFFTILLSGTFWTFIAIATDTAFYRPEANDSYPALFRHIWSSPVITPLNNILYNTKTSNLALHGLHPHYQHLLANLPQLLGPALIVLLAQCYPFSQRTIASVFLNPRLSSATTSILILSIVPHQEPRFLLPCIPLLLTCLRFPLSSQLRTLFWSTWVIFNLIFATLMGIYHQAGIIPAQLAMPELVAHSINSTASPSTNIEVFWWKTYPPPTHLLGSSLPLHPTSHTPLNISTISLQGLPQHDLLFLLMQHVPTCDPSLIERLTAHSQSTDVLVAAPLSAWRLPEDTYPSVHDFSFQVEFERPDVKLGLRNLRTWRRHLNLDDLDFGDDGVLPTLERVVGRRGLGVWRVERVCD